MASIFVAQSIERRNRYEAMLKSNGEKLRMLNKIIRHDLANDLAVIKSAVKIYNRNSDPNILSEVDNRVNKGLAAISDYKKYEEMLSVESKLYDYDITKIINSVWKNYQQLNLSIQGDAYVIADDSISSVFENLFSNAIRHGKASAINIGIKNTKDNSIITFSDNGKGIPDTIKDRIFEEGFHYGDTGNTGIGLYIVRQSIESYGGRITVADNKPRGTMFEIILRRALKQDQ